MLKNGVFSSKIYEVKVDTIVKNLQSGEEEVTDEELEKEKISVEEAKTGKSPYYIKVNYKANVVTVYTKDDSGNYTVPYKAMVCSCGTSTPTSGIYKTTKGKRWGALFGGVYGQYSTRIVGNILFHSVPYKSASPDSLEYWEYDKLGTTASMGCIRLQTVDCKWIYNNCPAGTMVEFYADSNPGPLGKPSAQKISSNETCRNWDPTDDTSGNPWLNYNVKETEKKSSETVDDVDKVDKNHKLEIEDDTIIND